ncbi:MAG: SMI1/KNR4 family protein [Candidatus Brocadiia bacterium]
MPGDMRRFVDRFDRRPGVKEDAVAKSEKQLGVKLPSEYLEFLKFTNGGEGFIGKGDYLMLWSVEELVPLNQSYEVQNYAPGLLIFGSDGGGEAYGFDTRPPQWPIVQVPFVGMDWNLARPMGESFVAFLERLREAEEMKAPHREPSSATPRCKGKQIFEITPVILGGSPTDPANKTLLSKEDHIKAVTFWNKIVADIRGRRADSGAAGKASIGFG